MSKCKHENMYHEIKGFWILKSIGFGCYDCGQKVSFGEHWSNIFLRDAVRSLKAKEGQRG